MGIITKIESGSRSCGSKDGGAHWRQSLQDKKERSKIAGLFGWVPLFESDYASQIADDYAPNTAINRRLALPVIYKATTVACPLGKLVN